MTTLRLAALPVAVLLSATGLLEPRPMMEILSAFKPSLRKYSPTAQARMTDSSPLDEKRGVEIGWESV